MKIYESTKGLHLDHPIKNHWKDASIAQSSIGNLTFRELLTHQSGLPAFLSTAKNGHTAWCKVNGMRSQLQRPTKVPNR